MGNDEDVFRTRFCLRFDLWITSSALAFTNRNRNRGLRSARLLATVESGMNSLSQRRAHRAKLSARNSFLGENAPVAGVLPTTTRYSSSGIRTSPRIQHLTLRICDAFHSASLSWGDTLFRIVHIPKTQPKYSHTLCCDKVVASVCLVCKKVIGYAPQPRATRIIEEAHVCHINGGDPGDVNAT